MSATSGKIFLCAIIDNSKDTEPPPRFEHIGQEVERPTFIRACRRHKRLPCSRRPLASAATLNGEPFFFVKPPQFLVVHGDTFAFEHEADTAITKTTAFAGDLTHALSYLGTIRYALSPHCFRIDADQPASTALRDVVF